MPEIIPTNHDVGDGGEEALSKNQLVTHREQNKVELCFVSCHLTLFTFGLSKPPSNASHSLNSLKQQTLPNISSAAQVK
jgi:hypothetical protein